ncbi:MAG: PAS domain-containing protein [Gammaproteobacteria bacterium]
MTDPNTSGANSNTPGSTAKRRAQAEQRFRTLFEQAPVGLNLVAPDGRPMASNPAFQAMLGYSEEELRSGTLLDRTHPADREASERNIQRLLDGEADQFVLEKRYLRKDGTELWALTTVLAIRLPAGAVDYLITLVQDISERKRADEALAEREARYHTVIETSVDGFWIADTDGRILEVNNAYVDRSGYSRDELLRMCIADLDVVETDEDVARHIARLVDTGNDLFESRHRTKSGDTWPVEVAVSHQPEAGGRVFAFLRDISDREAQRLELERRIDELERFNRASVGRELDMIELKKQVNALSGELGREPPFSLDFLGEAANSSRDGA